LEISGGEVIRRHVSDGLAAEDAHAVELAAIDQHLREAQGNRCRRGHHAMPAREQRCLVARIQHDHRVPVLVAAGLGLGDAVLLCRRHVPAGVHHLQRLEDALGQEYVQRLPGCDFDHATEHVGGMAVLPHRARLVAQRDFGQGFAKVLYGFLLPKVGIVVHLADLRLGREYAVS
jgi:hypothetical protein